MKKYIALLCLLTACSTTNTEQNKTKTQKSNCKDRVCYSRFGSRKRPSKGYEVYTSEVDAFICEGSAKGYIMYCDRSGDYITGVISSSDNAFSYYERGEEIKGIVLDTQSKKVKTFFTTDNSDKDFIMINYYDDGSISYKEIETKNSDRIEKFYKKGEKYNIPKDKEEIDKLIIFSKM